LRETRQFSIGKLPEDHLNVLCIDGVRKVVINWRFGRFSHAHKQLENEILYVEQRVRIAGELRVVPTDVGLWIFHLQAQ
jgi:hypothetical protein